MVLVYLAELTASACKRGHILLYHSCIVEDMGMTQTRCDVLRSSLKQMANPCLMTLNPATGNEIILEPVISNIL